MTAGAVLLLLAPLRPDGAHPQGDSTVDARRQPRAPEVVSRFTAAPDDCYPFRENMYTAVALPDGRMMALSVARRNGQQTMQGRYSADEGRTWTEPVDLFNFPPQAGGFALFDRLLDHDGELHLFILCDGHSGVLYPRTPGTTPVRPGQILDVWHVRSHGGRTRWSAPHRIWAGHGTDLLSVIQMRNGRIVLPLSFKRRSGYDDGREGFEAFTYHGTYGITSLYSDDQGATFQTSPDVLSVQTPDMHTYGADEPVVLQLKDGRVWMLMRTQRGRFYESFSSDGARWSAPRPTSLISSDSPAALIRLKDGSILLFSNACLRYPYAYGGRYALHGAISRDEGRTWRGFREVARDPLRNEPITFHGDYGLAYAFPTLTAQGHVLFSNWVESGRSRSFRLLDPAWLYENRQQTDFGSGIDDWSVFGSKGVETQPSPGDESGRVLSVRKADAQWPAGAVWNFPMGTRGRLDLELMLRPGFGGVQIG